jgi:hypothetical protein
VGNGGTTGQQQFIPGSYTVTETAGMGTNLGNYTATFSGDCDAKGNVNLLYGDTKQCTITNTLIQNPPLPPPVTGLEITNINPSIKTECDSPFTMIITGTGFEQGATVMLGGQELATEYISSTELHAKFGTPLPDAANSPWYITVVNPAPNSQTSNPETLEIDSCATNPPSSNPPDQNSNDGGGGDIQNNGLPLRESF